ncbi:hypothetical protein CRG98_017085 [Punica granatum]|uniref:Carbohydrate kinase PfkB domain-containing protein n=1 Tax=Punica granatum TaxID=22663 RepID=A0A2I0K1M6_PUNGR|nr:hypothetical protein CRG98_017085 [Punica granatum]
MDKDGVSANVPWNNDWPFAPSLNLLQFQGVNIHHKRGHTASARKKAVKNSVLLELTEDEADVRKKMPRTAKKATGRTRKKSTVDSPVDPSESAVTSDEETVASASVEDSQKKPRKTRKKAASTSTTVEDKPEKVRRGRKTKKKINDVEDKVSETELSEAEDSTFVANASDESEVELDLGKDDGEDISDSYGWPTLICCFGAAQHAFVPSGRPANRLIDYEIHERMKDALWAPEKFFRAPGGSAGSVATALATLGGKVAIMGKLGGDEYGQAMLYYLNVNNVQTRSVRIDNKRQSAKSVMKIGKRGRLKMSCIKPCAEDSLSKSDINIDVLKEAKMFYINTHSLLERNMRSTALQAIKISKKLGGLIFYDVNLPLPLWHSSEETKAFIQQVWELADFIEVTKQELEFLCGIDPSEEFDTQDNSKAKFMHYDPEILEPLWHQNLKVLFMTNGTSKIHYYTREHDGAVHGMEDPPLTPFTCDMSASGDAIVAALMRMLTVQPQLITEKGYLEHSIKYAIDCGVIDQWLLARTRGFPPKEGKEMATPDPNGILSITEKEYRTQALEAVS